MSLARKYSYNFLTFSPPLNGPVFPYPKELKEKGHASVVARDESGQFFKIAYPGNTDGIWIPKFDFGKDFTVFPVSFKKKSEFVYPDKVNEGLAFLIGKCRNGFYKIVFKGITFIAAWVPEDAFMKDFKRISVCLEHIMTAPVSGVPAALLAAAPDAAPAPADPVAVAAPAAPAAAPEVRKFARGRPRKAVNPELRKRFQNLLDEEVDADRLFASAAQTYKRIKLANKELVAEVQSLKSRIEELERNK